MHARFHNEAIFDLALRPRTPLLVKSGRSGEEALDPTLPEMNFVRTRRAGNVEGEVYVPGSSLRGVMRSHAEKLIRGVQPGAACDPTHMRQEAGPLRAACFGRKPNTREIDGPRAYVQSCYACRLFGNTALASRIRVGDLYGDETLAPVLVRRHGVAIDRVTGAVAQGPFDLELVSDGIFNGQITLRNFTLGQLGLVAAALLDLADGLVPMGYGKSRGLGRVELNFRKLQVRTLATPDGALLGVGALATDEHRTLYGLPAAERERLPVDRPFERERVFHTLTVRGQEARALLEAACDRWPSEVPDR